MSVFYNDKALEKVQMKELLNMYVQFSQPLLFKELKRRLIFLVSFGDNVFSLVNNYLFFFYTYTYLQTVADY